MSSTHASTSSRAGACMADGVVALTFRLGSLPVLEVFAVRLEGRHDVELWRPFARARANCTAIDHETRTV